MILWSFKVDFVRQYTDSDIRININDELEIIWKKAIAIYFKVYGLSGITDKVINRSVPIVSGIVKIQTGVNR